jgi:hypothetical protein
MCSIWRKILQRTAKTCNVLRALGLATSRTEVATNGRSTCNDLLVDGLDRTLTSHATGLCKLQLFATAEVSRGARTSRKLAKIYLQLATPAWSRTGALPLERCKLFAEWRGSKSLQDLQMYEQDSPPPDIWKTLQLFGLQVKVAMFCWKLQRFR